MLCFNETSQGCCVWRNSFAVLRSQSPPPPTPSTTARMWLICSFFVPLTRSCSRPRNVITPQRAARRDHRIRQAKFKLSSSCASKCSRTRRILGEMNIVAPSGTNKRLPHTTSGTAGHSSSETRPRRREKQTADSSPLLFLFPADHKLPFVFVLCPIVAELTRERDVVCLEDFFVTARHYHISTSVSIYLSVPKKKKAEPAFFFFSSV